MIDTLNIKKICMELSNNNKYSDHIESVQDIIVAGSRVYGFYKETSDLDIILFVKYNKKWTHHDKILCISILYENNIKYGITLQDINYLHRPYGGFVLPKYSCLSDSIVSGNKEEAIRYIQHKSKNVDWLEGRKIHRNLIGLTENDLPS
jgi:predicted nucleotidyltransferase